MADETITDDVTVGSIPGSIDGVQPTVPGTPVTIKAKGTVEYVSGGPLSFYTNMPRGLPWTLDDLTRDFGIDIYERMLFDPQVRNVVNVHKASVIGSGIDLMPAIEDRHADGYQQSKNLHDDCSRMLSDLVTGSFDQFLWDMADAAPMANRVAEKTYALDSSNATGRQQYRLTHLAVKPFESVAFVVDAFLNILGILGRVPGMPFNVQQGTVFQDISELPNLLPRSKFCVLTHRPVNNDPRGTSILRSAFDPWNAKTQMKAAYLKHLSQFATPSLVGKTPEMADAVEKRKPDGSLELDNDGYPILTTPAEAMQAELTKFANGTVIVVPFSAEVDVIAVQGNGQAFLDAFQYYDVQIAKAVLSAILATEEGEHQSRTGSGTHKDILDVIVLQGKRPMERMVQNDVIDDWVRINYGPDMLQFAPKATLTRVEAEDLAQKWAALARLRASNYLHPSQYAELDRMNGLPPRDEPTDTGQEINETIQVKEDAGAVKPPTGDTPDDTSDSTLDKNLDESIDTTPSSP